MAVTIPPALVEFILFGPEDDRRQLQDSPVLGDVWMEFARHPDAVLDLLITPYADSPAGVVATTLAQRLAEPTSRRNATVRKRSRPKHDVAYLQGVVAARLSFEDMVRTVVPMTHWWKGKAKDAATRAGFNDLDEIVKDVEHLLRAANAWFSQEQFDTAHRGGTRATHKRYITLAALIFWARDSKRRGKAEVSPQDIFGAQGERVETLAREGASALFDAFASYEGPRDGSIWTISLNRRATAALTKSVASVKADAARQLFSVNCSQIAWAVIDSGIDANHVAFQGTNGSRVARTFDFTRIRQIISLDNRSIARARQHVVELLNTPGLKSESMTPEQFALSVDRGTQALRQLASDAAKGRSIDWNLVEPFIELATGTRPANNHGTHVAGIIGAKAPLERSPLVPQAETVEQPATPVSADVVRTHSDSELDLPEAIADVGDGMCPDIRLFDFRVLGSSIKETEFAIIAALQYIRYLNDRNSYPTIHGANLSLSIPHDVKNYACGRTPICNECERLVSSGVVVVAAAGNRGYQNFQTKEGQYESYAAFSITDPGNADSVITVGSTHRSWPHTYGVSFFSSRGPTGDGRMKPDLVAPGERIRAPVSGETGLEWGDLDGTSMAAPHVSGAAAMLMARYSELIGQPRRLKQVLCDTATDLGRERSFQGYGMLDVLRAFQRI